MNIVIRRPVQRRLLVEMMLTHRGEIGGHTAVRRRDARFGVLDCLVLGAFEEVVAEDELGGRVVVCKAALEGEDDLLVAPHVFTAVDVPVHLLRTMSLTQRVWGGGFTCLFDPRLSIILVYRGGLTGVFFFVVESVC